MTSDMKYIIIMETVLQKITIVKSEATARTYKEKLGPQPL